MIRLALAALVAFPLPSLAASYTCENGRCYKTETYYKTGILGVTRPVNVSKPVSQSEFNAATQSVVVRREYVVPGSMRTTHINGVPVAEYNSARAQRYGAANCPDAAALESRIAKLEAEVAKLKRDRYLTAPDKPLSKKSTTVDKLTGPTVADWEGLSGPSVSEWDGPKPILVAQR